MARGLLAATVLGWGCLYRAGDCEDVMSRLSRIMANRRYRARLRGEFAPLLIRKWSQEECNELKTLYLAHIKYRGNWLRLFSEKHNRGIGNVSRKARQLNLPRCRTRIKPPSLLSEHTKHLHWWRSLTNNEKKKIRSERTHKMWQRYPHPRGMLGKHHTKEVCEIISRTHLGRSRKPFSEETKRRISENMQRRLRTNPEWFVRHARRGKFGRRKDLNNRFFRSTYEANYARFLNYTKQPWVYESKTFWFENIRRGIRSYTPDFYLKQIDEYHEVKGWMDRKSKTKLKRMKKYFPKVKVIVIDRSWFQDANRKGLCRLIPGWECSHKHHQTIVD